MADPKEVERTQKKVEETIKPAADDELSDADMESLAGGTQGPHTQTTCGGRPD
jgi:rRNA maturation endonuclease Nob1